MSIHGWLLTKRVQRFLMPDLPAPLARLIDKLLEAVADLTAQLERGEITARAWQREMEKLLTRYHEAAFMLGQESPELSDGAMAIIVKDVAFQLGFLDGFAATIAGAAGWQAAWLPRAGLYAQAIKKPYWQGVGAKVGLPALPNYPGDGGSECLGNCRCTIDVETLSEERGDYNVYWRLGAEKHCPTCPQRAKSWNPLKVRGGKIV
jgi:hypothetical protein